MTDGPGAAESEGLLGPGADERDAAREAVVCAAIGLAGYLSFQLVAIVLGSIATTAAGDLSDLQFTAVASVATGVGGVVFAAVYLEGSRHDESWLELDAPTLRDVGYVVGGLVLLIAVLYGIQIIAALLGLGLSDHQIGEAAETGDPLLVLALIPLSLLFVGPGEELVFRGIVQHRLRESFGQWQAIGIASLIFASIHFAAYATASLPRIVTSLALVFALSVLLGWVYERTRTLVVPALVHGSYNAIQFAILYSNVAG